MNGSVQETDSEEDQYQTHSNNCCVNSYNVHYITFENCYNYIPITRSSFLSFKFYFCHHVNLNIAILSLETSTDYCLTVRLSFSTGAGLVVSCILAIYLCGKEYFYYIDY